MLNLAVADLLYCVVVVPLTAVQFYEKGWKWGRFGCVLSGIVKYGIMTAEWMSIALIALTKCINLFFPKIGMKLFSGRNGLVFIALFWIFTFLWYIIPVYLFEVIESKGMAKSALDINFYKNIKFSVRYLWISL